MLDIRKMIKVALLNSSKPLDDIFIPINKRAGYKVAQSPVIPTYYYKYIGINENETVYYNELKELDKKLMDLQSLYLKFVDGIPLNDYKNISLKTEAIWKRYNPVLPSNKNHLFKELKEINVYPKLNNNLYATSVRESFIDLLMLYFNNENSINISKVKNFCLKIFSWINEYIPKIFGNLKGSSVESTINPKVVFYGNIKKHEIYFLTYLYYLGVDVLYINPCFNNGFEKKGQLYEIPNVFKLKKEGQLKKFPSYKKNSSNSVSINTDIKENTFKSQNSNLDIDNKDSIFTSPKKSNNPFEDIFTPLNHRAGYISGSTPFVPIYFYRYIGTDKKEDEYRHMLFNLDKKLSSLNNLYIKFTDSIPLNHDPELVRRTKGIWDKFKSINNSTPDMIIKKFIETKSFPDLKNELLNNTLIKNFKLVLDLYLSKSKNTNINKLKNFCLKLLIWSNVYTRKLLLGINYEDTNTPIKNPKILYYGDIKKHEVYFLILLSKLGADVLYLNPYSDTTFDKIDKEELHSKALHFKNKINIKEFPKEDVTIRVETNAFRASQEISRIIHNDQDGLYQHWQFESYKTSHVTLKSTYDELKLLWNEESRMRTGFKVEGDTVYIPNLFAKISGAYNDLNLYWDEIKQFKSVEQVLFLDKVPFTKSSFKTSDMYTSSSLINENGLNKKRLLEHQSYKYSYLKTALQDTIIDKINRLISSDMLKVNMNKEFKIKVIMTLLSLDKSILKLIQRFDYPFKVPKIIIYDNNESMFSDEDSIVLAFLNLIGFDILVLTPTGYNNIEDKIFNKYYDTHKLEEVRFDLELPDFNFLNTNKAKSFLANLLGRNK